MSVCFSSTLLLLKWLLMAEIGITPPSAPSLPVGIAWPKTRITPASGLVPAGSLGLPVRAPIKTTTSSVR